MESKKTSHISDFPSLLSEWDFEKNDFTPDKITLGSSRTVWWKCQYGHSWADVVIKRVHGKKCPYCTNKRVLVGYNDLSTLYPKIAAEWDYQNNSNIDINTVVPGCTKKVSWRCSVCGHVWITPIKNRTQNGSGCPVCALKARSLHRCETLVKQNGSLSNPDLLKTWDYEKNEPLRPENITPSSNKTVWWKCNICGHSWQAKISNRTHGRGCPACSNRVLIKGTNDLASRSPEIAAEWDFERNAPVTPSDIFSKSGRKYFWICPKGHSYSATPLHRVSGTNCPICNSGRQTSFAEQAIFFYIKKIFPDAISRYKDIFDNGMELDIFIPSIKLAIEYDGVFWHKTKNLKRDQAKYSICQNNGIRLIRIRESDVSVRDLADEVFHIDELDKQKNLALLIRYLLDRLDPRSNMWTRTTATFHSSVDVNLARDNHLIRHYMTVTKDSLEDLYPNLAAQWHPSKNGTLRPNVFKCGSDYKAWWLCPICGHEWQATIGHRVNGTGCPVCYRRESNAHPPQAKKVYQFSKDGTFIKEWNSMSEAGHALSISNSNIGLCAQGKRNYAGGYVWKFSPPK